MKTFLCAVLMCFAGIPNVSVFAFDLHSPAEDLTPKLRHVLQKEMHALVKEGRAIEGALAAGKTELVQKHAAQMHAAFIFQDEITTVDLRILKATLGDHFVEEDKAFHAMAWQLEKTESLSDQKVLFGSMLQACASCHSAYAPEASVLE